MYIYWASRANPTLTSTIEIEIPARADIYTLYTVFSPEILEGITFLPARASEQGNVIGSVSVYIYIYIYIYIYMSSKKNCN